MENEVIAVSGEPESKVNTVESVDSSKLNSQISTFPLPSSWYEPHVVAERGDMWGYIALNTVVVVEPQSGRIWPRFTLLGGVNKESSKDKFTAISFSYEEPLPSLPLVTGSDLGVVKLWSLETKAVSKFHDVHKNSHTVVQWSPHAEQRQLIYSMDVQGKISVWDTASNSLRVMDIGKFQTTCIAVSSHQPDFLAAGAKLGQIYTIRTVGRGDIMQKMRHEEEIYSLFWQPDGIWETSNDMKGFKKPFLVSSIATTKQPSIRVWDAAGRDVKFLRPWMKDMRSGKLTKSYGPSCIGKNPITNMLVLFTCGKSGEILSFANSISDHVHNLHNNVTIFGLIQSGDILWSFAHEPFIVGWNLRTEQPEVLIPTFRGICTMQFSPLESSRLALGGGDGMIRIVKMESPEYPELSPVEISSPIISPRVTGKVTALAWHPRKDHQLAFGTDEGVVGIFECKSNNKYTTIFDRRVKGTVYTVDWGIQMIFPGSADKTVKVDGGEVENGEAKPTNDHESGLFLYACGANNVYMINPRHRSNNLIDVGKKIQEANGVKNQSEKISATEIKWAPDFSYFVVGYNDGRIEVYSAPNFKLRCWIKCHSRGIQALTWRPHDFLPDSASTEKWLASASNDGSARIFNLAQLFTDDRNSEEVVKIMSSVATFNGHGGLRVITLAWSPHDVNLLVSVGYDKTAVVWNIKDGSRVARYTGHDSRLVSCLFHASHPSKVITCSDELVTNPCLHIWDYTEHTSNIDDYQQTKALAELTLSQTKPVPERVTVSTVRVERGGGDADFMDTKLKPKGVLSWDSFLAAVESFLEISEKLDDEWKKEVHGDMPGATFISMSCFREATLTAVDRSLLKCEYHVVYSISYSVPVIYFNVSLATGKLLPVEQVWAVLQNESDGNDSGQNFSAIISQQEHPILNLPYLFLHPCHTESIMKSFSFGSGARNSCDPDLHYLLSWLSIVGGVVGLPLCNDYGKYLALAANSKAKATKITSVLPMSSNRLINAKLDLVDDLKYLIDKVPLPPTSSQTGGDENVSENADSASTGETSRRKIDTSSIPASVEPFIHLTILGSVEDAKTLVNVEFEGHRHRGSWDGMSYLSAWNHSTSFIDDAIKEGRVTEHMLLVAAKYSKQLYERASDAYARQLIEKDDVHPAVNLYLLNGKVEEAIDVLVKKKLFREALVLAKIRLSIDDPITIEVQEKWVDHLTFSGNYELAAKILCSLGRYTEALAVIEQRNHPYAWLGAVYVAVKANDLARAEAFGLQYVEHMLTKGQYFEAVQLIKENDFLKWLHPIVLIHQYLSVLMATSKVEGEEDLVTHAKNFEENIRNIWKTNEIDAEDTLYPTKIQTTLLSLFPQNSYDVQLIVSKNLTLLLMDKKNKGSLAEDALKSAKVWFEPQAPHYYQIMEAIFHELTKSEVA